MRYGKLLGVIALLTVQVSTMFAQVQHAVSKDVTGHCSDSAYVIAATQPALNAKDYSEEWFSQKYRPLFALKTNLVFDAALAFNGEIEIPIGSNNRWSLMGEFWKPWFVWHHNSRAYQLQVVGGEARYWLGNSRYCRPWLTGWFLGAYYAWGKYDFEWGSNGDQGEFNSVGLTVGAVLSSRQQLLIGIPTLMLILLRVGIVEDGAARKTRRLLNIGNAHPVERFQDEHLECHAEQFAFMALS